MKWIFIVVFLQSYSLFGQTDTIWTKRNNMVYTSGIVSYYYWEEDAKGKIIPYSYQKPYLQNFIVVKNKEKLLGKEVSREKLMKVVLSFCHDLKKTNKKSYKVETIKKQRKKIPLIRSTAKSYRSVVFIKKPNGWESKICPTVHYFNVYSDGSSSYSHSSDSVILRTPNIRKKSNGHFTVITYWHEDGTFSYERVVSYTGEDVTTDFKTIHTTNGKRILVFVNGYRGPMKERDASDNMVIQRDRYMYWFKLDDRFIERLKPDVSFYLDGSLSISTSNHRTRLNFGWSILRTHFTKEQKKKPRFYKRFNTKSNDKGFEIRRENGRIAGLSFLYARCNSPQCENVKDTLDIVCHSMGYAYTLGFLEVVSEHVKLRNIYILAPENAGYAAPDWNLFDHVWQYGSNLGLENPDAVKHQDGVAPQTTLKNLDLLPKEKGGRICSPSTWPNKHFVHSHMVYSFDWIFDWIEKGQPGYIE